MLEHSLKSAVKGREDWHTWEGHARLCSKAKDKAPFQKKRYSVATGCRCRYKRQFTTDKPTIAPLNYIFANDSWLSRQYNPEDLPPFRPEIEEFSIRIVDEIDFGRFVEKLHASQKNVRTVAIEYPLKVVQAVCSHLLLLMQQLETSVDNVWNGPKLYERLDSELRRNRSNLEILAARLTTVMKYLRVKPWLKRTDARSLPPNFPLYLVPILNTEIQHYLSNKPFNPRIHLRTTNTGPSLHINWRRKVIHAVPTVILDATAEPLLIEKVFGDFEKGTSSPLFLPLPPNIIVNQWADDLVTKRTLGLYPFNDKEVRKRWYDRVSRRLRNYPKNISVGLITFKDIEKEAREFIRGLGFHKVKSLHYWALRSSNKLEGVDVLVLLGCPIPNPYEFMEEAQAFFYDEDPFQDERDAWEWRTEHLVMRNDNEVPVKVGGYFKENRLSAYFEQKCRWELYQALHRSRPLRVEPDRKQEIFIFTNMPIPGVRVDHLMRDEKKEELEERFKRAITIVKEQLALNGLVTSPQIASVLAGGDQNVRSIQTWVQRNASQIAEATDSCYIRGKGRRPSRFATSE